MNTHAEFQSASGYAPITKIGVGVDDTLDASLRRQAKSDEGAMPRVEQNAATVSPEVRCSSTTARHLTSADPACLPSAVTDPIAAFMSADHAHHATGKQMRFTDRSPAAVFARS